MAMNMATAAKLIREMGEKIETLESKVKKRDGLIGELKKRVDVLEEVDANAIVKKLSGIGIHFRRIP